MAYKSYKVKLKPTESQIAILKKTWDGYRVAYNFAVEREIHFFDDAVKTEYKTGKKQPKFITGASLCKEWTIYKKTLLPDKLGFDIYSIGSRTTVEAVYDCYSSCTSFFEHTKGHSALRPKQKRNPAFSSEELNEEDEPVRYLYIAPNGTKIYSLYYKTGGPRFKRYTDKISFPVGYHGLEVTNTEVYIPGLFGNEQSHSREESLFKLAQPRYIPTGIHQDEKGTRYINPRISFDGVDWWFSVGTDFVFEKPELHKGQLIAFDAGVASLATLDDGTSFTSPKDLPEYIKAYEKMIRLKSLLDHKRKRIKKQNTETGLNSKSYRKLQQKYYKALIHVNNIKSQHLHKCSKELVERLPEYIAMEELSVADMLKNKPVNPEQRKADGERKAERELHLNISTAGMSTFQNMVAYKAEWRGIQIQKVPAVYTSKTCHVCGYINHELTLGIPAWTCPECGTHHNRDFNAAINIRNRAIEQIKNPPQKKVKKSRPRIPKKSTGEVKQ